MTLTTVVLVFFVITGQAFLIAIVTVICFRCVRRRRYSKRRVPMPPSRPATPISESSESAASEASDDESDPPVSRDQMIEEIDKLSAEVEKWFDFIKSLFTTDKPRKIQDWELDIFSGPISAAYKKAKNMIKPSRRELFCNGAFSDGSKKWWFSMQTYRYIKRVKTSGYTAWYAFALKHGDDIKFDGGDAATEETLENMSIPALLSVFFRENLPDKIRRSAFGRIRRWMPITAKVTPDEKLLTLSYPLNLIPTLKRTRGQLFTDPED